MKNVRNNINVNKLSIRDAKKLCKQVINQELEKYKLQAKINPLTNVEMFPKLREDSISNIIIDFFKPSSFSSYYSFKKNKIVIAIDNYLNSDKREDQILALLDCCFHEARHAEQTLFAKDSYYGLLYFIDKINASCGNEYDFIRHDSYSYEIGANMYAIKQTREYMKCNYPYEYELKKREIDILDDIYYLEFLLYDAPYRIDRFLKIVKMGLEMGKLVWEEDANDKVKIIPNIFEVFLKKDGNFKDISEIINNDMFNKLDKRLIYNFFSCQTFLNGINLDNLSSVELSILREALNYTSELETLQINWLDDLYKKERELFQIRISNASALTKLSIISDYVLNEVLRNVRFRIYTKDREHFTKGYFLRKISKM